MWKLLWIAGVVLLAGAGVLGDYFIKLSGEVNPNLLSKPFLIGFCIYALTAFGWFFVMQHVKLGVLGVFYSISTVLLLFIVGVVFFKESFDFYEILGVILAITSLALLARFAG